LWISGLPARCQRADLNVTEPQHCQPGNDPRILVEAGSDAERIGKTQAADLYRTWRYLTRDTPQSRSADRVRLSQSQSS